MNFGKQLFGPHLIRYRISLEQKNDARLGGIYFVATAIVMGRYFEAQAFSRTAAIRELKKTIRFSESQNKNKPLGNSNSSDHLDDGPL